MNKRLNIHKRHSNRRARNKLTIRKINRAPRENGKSTYSFERAADDVMAAIKELHRRGGVEDVFHRVPAEA